MDMRAPLYLDNNATTEPDPAVVQAVLSALGSDWGNPSSMHAPGQQAKQLIARSRAAVGALVGARPAEVCFTSSATEATATALLGAVKRDRAPAAIALSAIEHAGAQQLADTLASQGVQVLRIAVDARGVIDPDALRAVLSRPLALLSVMAANNETGVLQPLDEVAALAAAAGVPLHVDATQMVGRLPLDMQTLGADLLSMSAHKLHGPKGIGALVLRKGLSWPALIPGHQERHRRGGTENMPGIAGFAVAAQLARQRLEQVAPLTALRDRLEAGLMRSLPDMHIYGAGAPRLPNTSCFRVGRISAERLLTLMEKRGLYASSGSACTAGGTEPSHVLMAMGASREEALCAVRISLSHLNTEADIDRVIDILPDLL